MLALTMMEQSIDVDRFRCEPIGRHKRTRAGRVASSHALPVMTQQLDCNAAVAAAAIVVSYIRSQQITETDNLSLTLSLYLSPYLINVFSKVPCMHVTIGL